MGIPFKDITKSGLIYDHLAPRLAAEKKTFVVTGNPDIVMQTRKNPAYKKVLQEEADIVVADGIGVIHAAKIMGKPLKERIPGVEVVEDLMHLCVEKGYSCYFLGAEQSVNERAVAQIKEKFPQLRIAGSHHGFFDMNDSSIATTVAATKPDVIFIALGAPKQEMWTSSYIDRFEKGTFIGVGGSLDVFAGEVKRAPAFWIKLNLEWFYRIMTQPSRIKRIWSSFWFMILIILGRGKK